MKIVTKEQADKGLALIIVLGFLAIFLMLALSFALTMRTERLASEVAKESTQADILLRGAMQAAMEDVNYRLSSLNPVNNANLPDPANIHVPYNWMIMRSEEDFQGYAPGRRVVEDLTTKLFSGEATNWIPRRYHGDQFQPTNLQGQLQGDMAEWIDVIPGGGTNEMIGRYAYVCFDCTGLLDANYMSGLPVRRDGTAIVSEVSFQVLPEIGTAPKSIAYDTHLTTNHYYNTVPEIMFMSGANASDVNNLMPYSLCYERGWWDWAARRWENGYAGIPEDIDTWTPADISSFFNTFYPSYAVAMSKCYQDYIDTDSLPGVTGTGTPDTGIPCCEPIPMINEIIVSNEVIGAGAATIVLKVSVSLELWYPYLSQTNTATYIPRIRHMRIRAANGSIRVCNNNFDNQTGAAGLTPNVDGEYKTVTLPAFLTPATPIDTNNNLVVQVDQFDFELRQGSLAVDRVNLGAEYIRTRHDLNPASLPGKDSVVLSCADPRLNHLVSFSATGQDNWEVVGRTADAPNENTTGFCISYANGDLEGTNMFVRNAPMRSIAEMGFIPTGERWSTIDLFSPEGRAIMSRYRAADDISYSRLLLAGNSNVVAYQRYYTNSFVNPNSTFYNALAALFVDTVASHYPGEPTPSVLSVMQAEMIASNMMALSTNYTLNVTNMIDSPGAFASSPAFLPSSQNGYLSYVEKFSNNQKEAVIRNTYRLFSPTQNMLTFIVIAQSIQDEGRAGIWEPDFDTVTGERRAVMLVWRDPFPDANGVHHMFIRQAKLLDE